MVKDLSLLGIERAALDNEELGEEDAKYLGHTVGLDSFLKAMEKQEKEIYNSMKLVSMIVETSLRNVYGCPMTVCYWSPPKSKIGHIRMTNPALQLISTITMNFSEKHYTLVRSIAHHLYSRSEQRDLAKLKLLVHDALEWATVPPNPQTPLFFNQEHQIGVLVDYHSVKVFKSDGIKTYGEDGLVPAWARQISDVWKMKHATGIYSVYKDQNILFTKLNAIPPKVEKVIVLEDQQ